jgi:hypothetical protein
MMQIRKSNTSFARFISPSETVSSLGMGVRMISVCQDVYSCWQSDHTVNEGTVLHDYLESLRAAEIWHDFGQQNRDEMRVFT